MHTRLAQVHDAIQAFRPRVPQLPVIGLSANNDSDNVDALPGLRCLREEIKRNAEILRENPNSSTVSNSVPYLVAVCDELIHAHQPIAVYRTFSFPPVDGQERFKGKTRNRKAPAPVKVDVVTDNGTRWVRVNTIKNTRLVMEFREMDSYLTSDDGDDVRDELRHSCLARTELDNSLLRMGEALVAAAKVNPVVVPILPASSVADTPATTTIIPQVTLRLTRLNPLDDDPRIAQTIECLHDMDIDVRLGERPRHPASALPIPNTPARPGPRTLVPTTNINLDLSALIALVSDTTHAPLPLTEQDALARFVPPRSYLDRKKDRAASFARKTDDHGEGTWANSGQHSRALAAQAIQEMQKGTLEEIRERMLSTTGSRTMTFWTTREARRRCLQIVAQIGEQRERQRADALLGSTHCSSAFAPVPVTVPQTCMTCTNGVATALEATNTTVADAYWRHSRYPAEFVPFLVPVQVYPSTLPPANDKKDKDRQAKTVFVDALVRTCTQVLNGVGPPSVPGVLAGGRSALNDEDDDDIGVPPAVQTSVPKLTAHTVASMLAGASRGHTTVTTNKSSVRTVLKAMHNAYRGGAYMYGYDGVEASTEVEQAALWVLDPRSLSEGMRSDLVQFR